MKGCTDYTEEATRWHRDDRKRARPIRAALIIALAAFIVLIMFVIWPKIHTEGFSVATAQTTSKHQQESFEQSTKTEAAANPSSVNEGSDKKIVVYLTGAVLNPGVFELGTHARLNDAIVLAGGLNENAAANYINLAANLQDGMHIHIPTTEEMASGEAERIVSSGALSQSHDPAGTSGASGQSTIKININSADSKGLQTLTGIGEATAKKIIEYREKNGPFKSIEDLKNVSGIGDKKFENLADSICV